MNISETIKLKATPLTANNGVSRHKQGKPIATAIK